MKKSLTFVIVMMCLIISTTCCWADNEQSQDESQGPIDIPYASVTDVYVGFTNLKGTAKCKAEIFLKAGSHVENAHITATIRKSSNNVVKLLAILLHLKKAKNILQHQVVKNHVKYLGRYL